MKFSTIALALFCVIFFGCAPVEKDNTSYPIGVLLPLNDSNTYASMDVLRGMELAVEQINSTGGLQGLMLKLLVKDASIGADRSFEESFDWLRSKGAKVINVGFDENVVPRHYRLLKADNVFINYLCQYPPATLDSENSTRIFINASQEGEMLSKLVDSVGSGERRIVQMSSDSLYGKACGDYLAFFLKTENAKFYGDVFSDGTKDFSVFSDQMKRLYPEYVFYVGRSAELAPFARSVASSGFKGVFASSSVFNFKKFPLPEGMKFYRIATKFELGKLSNPTSKKFCADYTAKFGRVPTWLSAYGYDSIIQLSKAIEKTRFNPSKMRECFKNTSFDGAIGKVVFDSTADSKSELELVREN